MYAPLQKQNKAAAKTSSQGLARANRQPANQPEHLTADLQDSRESQSATKTAHASPGGTGVQPTGGGNHFRHNFADISIFHRPIRGLQAKLTVNVPGDAYEQEADQVAEQVMRMPEPQAAPMPQFSGRAAGVQRECACGGTCDDCKKKNHDEEHAKVQMKAAGPINAGGMEAPPIVHDVLRSPGQPLDASTRAFMEPRFGHDFSKVRVHTDEKAVESARAVGARAYTVGQNVVFGNREYAPGTQEGQRLLGHELAHVVQQGNGHVSVLHRQPAGEDADDTAGLRRELESKKSERAMLGRMLIDLEKKTTEDVTQRRIETPSKGQEGKLKAAAQSGSTYGGFMSGVTQQLLQNKIDLVTTQDGFTIKIRFEISYEGLNDKEGTAQAAKDIPRIEKAIRDAWTANFTKGHFTGKKFRTEPHIKFRSNNAKPDDTALQVIVRHERKGDSFAEGVPGVSTAISLNPKHLEGDEVITVAHELYHVFGAPDAYYIPDEKERKRDPQGAGAQYVVGRKDPAGRGDLLGMVSKAKLKDWRAKGYISQADFDRQMHAPLTVWEEDADTLLYRLGAAPNVPKTNNVADPNSPAFDPDEALRQQESGYKQKLEKLQGDIDRDAETADYIQKAERAIQLDKEIAELQRKITDREEGAIMRRPRAKP